MLPHPAHLTCVNQNCTSSLNPPNVSKLDSGIIKPEYASINVTEIFNWLEQNFAPIADKKQLGFRLYFPMKEALFVRSDIGLIHSILMNLVSNAIKFTSNGAILISARRRKSDVLFQVWDTGIGIEDRQIEHIFDEFYQVGNQQRNRMEGLGLGLSIAKRAITLLDGGITCRSQIGRGSVFGFRLRLDDASGSVMLPETIATALPENGEYWPLVQGRRFIVIEDDMLIVQALTASLEALGGEVRCFHSAEDALHHANVMHADYYIADYMLGGKLNGIQLLNRLKQQNNKPINAVLMTGDTSPAFIREAANCGWPVLHKPVNMFKLISSLNVQEETHT